MRRALPWLATAGLVALAFAAELRTSWLQSLVGSQLASRLHFAVEAGASPAMPAPRGGPYDERLGYTRLRDRIASLEQRGWKVVSQARSSPALVRLADWGFQPVYAEKTRAGLHIEDRHGHLLFEASHPQRVYPDFASIPPLVLDTLLFIENRELLEPGFPRRNPAIEWDRLAHAVVVRVLPFPNSARAPGGSTLATQIEKYRHSPEGLTATPAEKLRQIASASLRAYLAGPATLATRRRIAVDYLNSVPLAAAPGIGEVNGLGDGLWAWYGTEHGAANRLLDPRNPVEPAARGRAYRQILSLLVSERRPSYYLVEDRPALGALTDHYLRLLHGAGVIDAELRNAALAAPLEFRVSAPPRPRASFADTKATDAVRAELLDLLGEPRLYDLDRLDLTARTSLDQRVQNAVTRELTALADQRVAREAGLLEPRLLARGDPRGVVYSLLLFERTEAGNVLRVLADTLDRPFNVNEGMKLDLGSTAKLRTLIHYLQIVADLHHRYAGLPPEVLAAEPVHPSDRIRRFVVDELRARPQLALAELLDAALERRYSASPHARFFTGGGLHHFQNYDRRHDGEVFSVRQAFQHSVNLPFIRLMLDLVNHVVYGPTGFAERLLSDPDEPWRKEYLRRFVDREAQAFLERFHAEYRPRSPLARVDALVLAGPARPVRLAALFRSLFPEQGPAALRPFLEARLAGARVSPHEAQRLHRMLAPEQLPLHDRAHLAGVHPLELWLVGYLQAHPDATLAEVLDASAPVRLDAYQWLFRSRSREAQALRVRTILEQEAFAEIHRAWQRLGYPFESLVPSLATAIGVSADRPAALAELMGIVANQGRRIPVHRIEELHFGEGTPYETGMRRTPEPGEPVLRPEVASAVRELLVEVARRGTARRVGQGFQRPDGTRAAVGGKTGTGDSRHETFSSDGRLLASRVLSRTASFAFLLGDRHFGVITAYVDGPEASEYEFTSSLPLQVLKHLEPSLAALLGPEPDATRVAQQANSG